MIDAHKQKYWNLYWDVANTAALQSVATRRRVGCCIVTAQGMLGIGWNGMPSGFPNQCEQVVSRINPAHLPQTEKTMVTDPRVIHAERNALDKLTREGISPRGAMVFVTTSPCLECAKSLYAVGVASVHYDELYRDHAGIQLLHDAGVPVFDRNGVQQP